MLAASGFIITAVFFAIFATTFNSLVIRNTHLKLASFAYAYYVLALTFFIWGVACVIDSPGLLAKSVIVGDALLLLSTVMLIGLIGIKNARRWQILAGVVSAGLMLIRIKTYYPIPYLSQGVLIFNTQTPVSIVLGLAFLLVWLPVNLRVAKQVTASIGETGLSSIYSMIYTVATISALFFIASRRVITVVLSFVVIAICFALLIKSNLLVTKVKEQSHGTQ